MRRAPAVRCGMRIVTLTMNPAVDVFADVPHVVPADKLRCTSVRRDAGGGGINVARVVARLGGDVRAVFPIGGPIGDLLRQLVEGEGVASETVAIAGSTREDFTVEEQETHAQYRFVLPGPALTEAEWRACLSLIADRSDKPAFLVASGSLPPGVPDDFLAQAVRAAKAHGAKAVVDSSGAALAACLDEGVFLVKPNLRELEGLVGASLGTREAWLGACRDLIARGGTEAVALTLGERGGLLVTRAQALYAAALPVETLSAVGAGDSFTAALVWSLAERHDLADAFRYAMAAGAAALLTPGTELSRAEDVRRLYPAVQSEAL